MTGRGTTCPHGLPDYPFGHTSKCPECVVTDNGRESGRTPSPVNVDDHIRDKDGNLRGYGYYLAFDYTGVEAVDRILAALHLASKAYHNTEGWNEEMSGRDDDYSYSDLIQQAANEAAQSFRGANHV